LNAAAADAYRIRFRQVLEHIDAHLDKDLSVERLSGVAAFSKYHFHRQFAELFEIGVHKYVQLVRLKRASYQLAFRSDVRIIDIAMSSGYDSHEAFSRAFKKAIGQTPSEFRDTPEWEPWHALYQPLTEMRSQTMTANHSADDVKIVSFPETRIAAFEHRGDPKGIGDSVRAFVAWRKKSNLPPRLFATYNILYDNPDETPPDEFRLDISVAIPRDVSTANNSVDIVEKNIPAGRCAVLRHVGSDDTLGQSLRFLYATWLPASGEELRDFPLFVQRVAFFPDVPENEATVDIFLPLR